VIATLVLRGLRYQPLPSKASQCVALKLMSGIKAQQKAQGSSTASLSLFGVYFQIVRLLSEYNQGSF
jgi:hypothetical protein